MDSPKDKLKAVFQSYPEVQLAYLFGSRALGTAGPQSDYDFAVYLDKNSATKMFDIKLSLMAQLSRLLQTDCVDVVVINLTAPPELKYDIITQGELLFEREPYRVLIEPALLNEYFDFRDLLRRNGLTKA